MGERLTVATTATNETTSLLQTIVPESDSTTLKIYFNKYGCIEIENLDELRNDTLRIADFQVYPDCEQKGTWFRKTTYDNDDEGERDALNYETEIESEFNLKDGKCYVPDSLSLTINEVEYQSEVEKHTQEGLVTTGQGKTKGLLFREKKYFHFKEVELYLIRKVKIEIKNTGASNK